MKIDGSAFKQRLAPATAGGNAGQVDNSHEAQIRRLQKKRQDYVEKLRNVRDETDDPEQAEQLAKMYQMAITSIDARIAQLEKAKADEAQRREEEQQTAIEPARESGANGKTDGASRKKEVEKPESVDEAMESHSADDPLALQEDEELFWIEGEDGAWPGKRRKPKPPSVLIDLSV